MSTEWIWPLLQSLPLNELLTVARRLGVRPEHEPVPLLLAHVEEAAREVPRQDLERLLLESTGVRISQQPREPLHRAHGFFRGLPTGAGVIAPVDTDAFEYIWVDAEQVRRSRIWTGDAITVLFEDPVQGERYPRARLIQDARTLEPAEMAGSPGVQRLLIPVLTDLSVDELILLLSGLRSTCDVLLSLRLASPRGGTEIDGDAGLGLRLVRESIERLAPEARLRIASIQMSSPGHINLEGSGEIVEAASNFFETVFQRKARREALEIANERERERLQHEKERNALAAGLERVQTLKAIFVELYGPSVFDTSAGYELFREFLASTDEVERLAANGQIGPPALPPPSDPGSR